MKNTIKHITLLLLTLSITLISCEKDDNSEEQYQNQLNPPAWIQGTWIDLSNTNIRTGYTFTTDDMLTIIGNNSASVKASLTDTDDIAENITASAYSFTITHNATNSTETWEFAKTDDTHIVSTHGTVSVNLTKE
jgi:hypothetical protein